MKALPVVTVLLIAAAGGAGYWYMDQRVPVAKPDTYQGYVDGNLLQVGPEISGRIILLSVDEGSSVRAGELLIKLDDTMQQAQVELAAARLEEARARLRLAQAQRRRPEEIRILEAAVKQAEAALEVSRSEYDRGRPGPRHGTAGGSPPPARNGPPARPCGGDQRGLGQRPGRGGAASGGQDAVAPYPRGSAGHRHGAGDLLPAG